MSNDYAASVQGVALRVVKLDADGTPLAGVKSGYVTNAFMSLGFTPEYTEGDEIEEKGANGEVCVYYKMPDTLKRVTFNLAICSPDPELTEILVGGTLLSPVAGAFTGTVSNSALTDNLATVTLNTVTGLNPGDMVEVSGMGAPFDGVHQLIDVNTSPKTITFATAVNADIPSASDTGTVVSGSSSGYGYAAPATGMNPTPNGIGFEVWSKAIVGGRPAPVNPYWRWVFPYAQMKLSGDRVLENGAMANTFEGYGLGNAQFGTGPVGDWPFPTTSAFQYARDAAAPSDYGYLEVA